MKINLSAKTAYTLWQAYNTHLRLGNKLRASIYKFILANTYSSESSEAKPEPKPVPPTLGIAQILSYDCMETIEHKEGEIPWSLSLTDRVLLITSMGDEDDEYTEELSALEAMKEFSLENLCKWHPDCFIKSCEYCTDGDGVGTPMHKVTPHYNNYGHCIALTV